MAEPSLSSTSKSPPSLTTIDPFSEHELQLERQAVRKLDYTIIPVMSILYLLGSLDRTNIGNARVAGLQKDLHLTDKQYQICNTIIIVPYIVAELPSNLLFRKIGARLLFPTSVVLWSITATLQGFVTSYAGLATVRSFLGLVEGPMAPGIILYFSSFYVRKELSFRIAIVMTFASLSGTFSGLLAAAIENMNGIGGRPGWAWIFIVEGLLSIFVGSLAFFLVPSTPRDFKLLTECQKELLINRLERDRPTLKLVDRFSFKEIVRSAASPHVIMFFIMHFFHSTMTSGNALFLPSIVNQLGFSRHATQLLSAGPFAAGSLVTLFASFLSDRYESRGITAALVSMLAVAGFALYLGAAAAENKFLLYGALFLIVPGVSGGTPIISAWLANNSEPHYRRATNIALILIFNSAGGVLGTWSFPTKDGPKFTKAMTRNLVFSILIVVGCLVNVAYFSWRNKVKKRPGVRAKLLEKYVIADKEGEGDGELKAWTELGDRHPDFVYTL